MKLTDTEIRKKKPELKPKKLTDGMGLYLLVTPQGSKLWRYQYRFHGKPKQISFGYTAHTAMTS